MSYVWHATPVKTWEDMRTQTVRFGATAASGDNAIFPGLANKLLGLKSEVITGYRGVAEILLAMERGELEANNSAYSTLGVSKPDWKRDNKVRYVMQFGVERISELSDVPTLYELVQDPDDKKMLRFFFLKFEMHRPIYAPPGVPKERLEALRTAFDKTVKDPEFLAHRRQDGPMDQAARRRGRGEARRRDHDDAAADRRPPAQDARGRRHQVKARRSAATSGEVIA